ncbi:uncharacterized protein LOC111054734 [Nilaparvata lugens]|uniref:uncharacterized protein LOC111054734 n=1 Tax=Nilaparvata lugens TaxID=108931 RepID=UPI00193CA72A|nr:uncharacterized protein LOC111054734 [Nilaparvata lugens]
MYFSVLVYCSVLFWARDSLAVQERLVQEIPYRENLIPGKLFSKPTGLSGDSLIIGTNVTQLLQDQVNPLQYTCRREQHSVTDAELGFSADIKIINRTSGNFELMPGEENNNARVRPSSDYFIPIRREIWDCNPHSESAGLKVYRIVTELISIKEILQVKYFEGVEVSSVNYFGQGWRTKVKEIRYIGEYNKGTGDYRALKYSE